MKVKEGRKMRSNTFRHFFAVLLTIAALAAEPCAWAQAIPPTFPVEVTFRGEMQNGQNGQNGKYSCMIFSPLHGSYSYYAQQKDIPNNWPYICFDNQVLDIGSNAVPLTMTVRGNFSFGATAGDATVDGINADLTFNSSVKHIVGVQVSTYSGTPVSVWSITGTTFSRIVFMLGNTTFGKVTLTMATHTPFDYAATISGIEGTYIDDGINQPVPTVTYKEFENSTPITLTEGVDYTVSYNVGSTGGTVTVTGMGEYTGTKSKSYSIRQPQLSDFTQLTDGSYEIATKEDLDMLSKFVKNGNNCKDVTFRQTADITYGYTTGWNVDTSENNFTPIGGYGYSFRGTFDGQGYTISGIRVWKAEDGFDATSLGLFGYVADGGTVKNVILGNAKIAGHMNIGGIVGYISGGVVIDCFIYHTYVIHTQHRPAGHIAGYQSTSVINRVYYRACEISSDWSQHNIFTLSAAAGVVLPTRTGGTIVNASLTTYADGITLSGTVYYSAGSTVTLGYSGEVPEGQFVLYTVNGEYIQGNTFTMPDRDVTVEATLGTSTLPLSAAPASIFGESKYVTTFYHGALDYKLPEGARAFTVSIDGNNSVLHLVGEDGSIIPHGTAVIIVADSASVTLTKLESTDVTAHAWNILQGSDTAVAVSGLSGTPYVLNISGGVLGFYKFTGSSIPAGKAYYTTLW